MSTYVTDFGYYTDTSQVSYNASTNLSTIFQNLTDSVEISTISILARASGGAIPEYELYIDTSEDNSTYTTVHSQTVTEGSIDTSWHTLTFTVNETITAKYIRIRIPPTSGGKGTSSYPLRGGSGLLYLSGTQVVMEITTDLTPPWYLDTDSYAVTVDCYSNIQPYTGFKNPYKLLDVWKLDTNNDGYPWTWGWDKTTPATGEIYVKTSSGWELATLYVKTASGWELATPYVKTSNGWEGI